MPQDCSFCRQIARPGVLLVLAALALLLLWAGGNWLRALLLAYLALLVLLGLIVLAVLAQRVLAKLCWKWRADSKGAGSQGHPPSRPVRVPATIYKKPDPLLYSQGWFARRGLAVTWDNPDIRLFEVTGAGTVPAQAHALAPGRPHLIRAQVWNGSTEAPAVNLLVRFAFLTFGIGTRRDVIGEMLLPDLPVKGALGLPRIAEMAWTTPPAPGHYCVQVELVWGDDADQGNNLGQTNLDVKKLNSPNASFAFPLRNSGVLPARLRLTTDAYRLPAPLPCDEARTDRRQQDRVERHLPERSPLPPGWQVTLGGHTEEPLAAGAERPLTVKVTAPDGFAGELDINVNAFDGLELVGGVTLRVHS